MMNRFRLQHALTFLLAMSSSSTSGAMAKTCGSDTKSFNKCGRSTNFCVSANRFNLTLANLASKSGTDPSESLEEIQEEFHSTFVGDDASVHAAWCESTIAYNLVWPMDGGEEHAEKVVFYKGEKCASAEACLDCGGDFSLVWFGYDCTNVEGGVQKECCQDLTPDVAEPVVQGGGATTTPACADAGIKDWDDCIAAGGREWHEESVFGFGACTRCTGLAQSDIGVVPQNICNTCSSANESKGWWMAAMATTVAGMMFCMNW